MATYNGYTYIPAKYHGGTRASTRLIVIHTAEVPLKAGVATAVANYFASDRSPKASVHATADDTSVIRSLKDEEVAYGAGTHANILGVHIEHAGYASFTPAQWDNDYVHSMLIKSATQTALWAVKYHIPVIHLTPEEILAGKAGFVGHNDVRLAWPKDTTHSDPGKSWPWELYLSLVVAEVRRITSTPVVVPKPTIPQKIVTAITRPKVSLSQARAAAKHDPNVSGTPKTYPKSVLPIEKALVSERLLDKRYADGHYGTLTVSAYSKWQRRLGYFGKDADGIPGEKSLKELGKKNGFTVVP